MALTKITPQMFDTSATAHDLNVDNGTFVVDGSASRVGIGTATPSALLDVNGALTVSGTSTLGVVDASSFTDVITNTIYTQSSSLDIDTVLTGRDVTFTQGSTNLMIVKGDASGIGINNIAPDEKLHVSGGIKVDGAATMASGAGTGLFLDYSSNVGRITSLDQGTAWRSLRLNAADIQFYIANGQVMTLESTGRLALGHTTTTGAKFAICDGANSQIQFFPEFSTDNNLTQHFDITASAYMASETRAGSYVFKIGTSAALTIDSSSNATFAGNITAGTKLISLADTVTNEGGHVLLRANTGGAKQYSIDVDTGNLFRIIAEDDSTAANGFVIASADGSGNFFISTANANPHTLTSGGGTKFFNNVGSLLAIARDSQTVIAANRSGSSPGTVMDFRMDGTIKGTLGVSSSGFIINESGGNVGMGTTSPSENLHISSGASGDHTRVHITKTSTAGTAGVSMRSKDSSNTWTIFSEDASASDLYFYDGSDYVMTLDSANNRAGIGTTSPLKTFHVLGGSNIDTMMINNVAGNNTNRYGGITGINYAGNQSALINYYSDSGQNYLHLGSNGNTNFRGPTMMRFYTASGADTTTHTERFRVQEGNSNGSIQSGAFGVSGVNCTAAFHGLSNAALVLSTTHLSTSASSYGYAERGGRYLTSNGSGWTGDGKDPALVIGSSDSATNRVNVGIVLHNEHLNNNTFSPTISFGTKSNSTSYNTMYGYIMGRKVGQGVDANWSTGEIHMDTAGTRIGTSTRTAYMADIPAFMMDQHGDINMPYKAYAYGNMSGGTITPPSNGTGFALNTVRYQNCTPQTNASHGPGITITKAGFYILYGSILYDPAGTYIYIGWAVNGTIIHHFHSNHTISANHDAISSIGRYLSVGDHVTFENYTQTITQLYGNAHSTWYIYKVG